MVEERGRAGFDKTFRGPTMFGFRMDGAYSVERTRETMDDQGVMDVPVRIRKRPGW